MPGESEGRSFRCVDALAHALKRAHTFNRAIIEPGRLHVSVFFLGELSEQTVQIACEAAAEVRVPPFEIWFDRYFGGRASLALFPTCRIDGSPFSHPLPALCTLSCVLRPNSQLTPL